MPAAIPRPSAKARMAAGPKSPLTTKSRSFSDGMSVPRELVRLLSSAPFSRYRPVIDERRLPVQQQMPDLMEQAEPEDIRPSAAEAQHQNGLFGARPKRRPMGVRFRKMSGATSATPPAASRLSGRGKARGLIFVKARRSFGRPQRRLVEGRSGDVVGPQLRATRRTSARRPGHSGTRPTSDCGGTRRRRPRLGQVVERGYSIEPMELSDLMLDVARSLDTGRSGQLPVRRITQIGQLPLNEPLLGLVSLGQLILALQASPIGELPVPFRAGGRWPQSVLSALMISLIA